MIQTFAHKWCSMSSKAIITERLLFDQGTGQFGYFGKEIKTSLMHPGLFFDFIIYWWASTDFYTYWIDYK